MVGDIELVGNALCLDYVNTVNARPDPRSDRLETAATAAQWAEAVGHRLDGAGVSGRALANARGFRELLHGVFAAIADGSTPDDGDLARLARAYARAVNSARITSADGRFALTWPSNGSLESLLHRVADSAVRLLADGPLDRVGGCPSCGWLFVDTSKNGRRRWCSMATCGARDKARRHYLATAGKSARR